MSCYTISFRALGLTVSGIYLPPSLEKDTVHDILDGLSASDVVLGDINTRFKNISTQNLKLAVGPPERLDEFARFQ